MPELSVSLIVGSFVAGLLMFLAPCTWPLIPGYLAFISGGLETNKKYLTHALVFSLGFSAVFVCLGVILGLFGSIFGPLLFILERVVGVLIIFFALQMLNLITIPVLNRQHVIRFPKWLIPGQLRSSMAIGAFFAFGWSPCIGPVLATVLLLASTTATWVTGGFLLVVFASGFCIPFIIFALLMQYGSKHITLPNSVITTINVGGGVAFLVIGLLFATGLFDDVVAHFVQLLSETPWSSITERY